MSLATSAVRIKVTLSEVQPQVMRLLVVPLAIRLDRLHTTLQTAFGWTDTHLYEFRASGMGWGVPDPDGGFGDEPIDARKARLYDIIRETGAKTIHYLYDFGDGWDHVIKIEKQFNDTVVMGMPFMLDGIGRCPPEDVGGPHGYQRYLAAIKDPNHPDHEELVDWGPEAFDPNVFDRKRVDAALDELARRWEPKPRRKK